MLTDTGCELLKTKSLMTAFFSYVSISQIKKLCQGVIQITLDEGVSYFFTSQDSDSLIKELVQRASSWGNYIRSIRALDIGEVSDLGSIIPISGTFSPPITPYSMDAISGSSNDNQFLPITMGNNQANNSNKGTSIYRSYNTKLDRMTKTSIIDRVYSHVLRLINDPEYKIIQKIRGKFKQDIEKCTVEEDFIKHYHLAMKRMRDQIIKDHSNDFAKIFTEKYCKDPEVFSEVEETSGRCIEDVLMRTQLNNKVYIYDLFKKSVEMKWETKSIAINEAMRDLSVTNNITYEAFEIKPGLRDEYNYQEICEEILKIHEEYKRDATYYICRNLQLPTPTYLLNKEIEIINKVNQLISERSPNGKKARAKGDFFVVGAEDFNPVFEMCVAKSGSEDIFYLSAFARDFLDPILTEREKGYYSTSISGLIESIIITCNKVHEDNYKAQLSDLLNNNNSLKDFDKIVELLKADEQIDRSLKEMSKFVNSYRNEAHKLSLELAPIRKKEKFTDLLVNEKLTEKLKDIVFSKTSLLKNFLNYMPLCFRRDVLLGNEFLLSDEFPIAKDTTKMRDINMLVDVLKQLDNGKSGDIPLCIPHTVLDGVTFTLKRISQRNKEKFEEMFSYAFIKYKNPLIHVTIRFYKSAISIYNRKSEIFDMLYDISNEILEKLNSRITETCHNCFIVLENSEKEKEKTSENTNNDHGKVNDSQKWVFSEILDKYKDILSVNNIAEKLKEIADGENNWSEISKEVNRYVNTIYKDLFENEEDVSYYLSKVHAVANYVLMYVFGKEEVSRAFIDKIASPSPSKSQVDGEHYKSFSEISKTLLPDYVLIYQVFGKFLQTEYEHNEIRIQGKEDLGDIDPDDMSYHDIKKIAQHYEKESEDPSKALVEYAGFINDMLVASLASPARGE